ncbi:serine-type peptidase [Ascochyta rabiei]|uniref:Serine-type peptidase n=1 Tax=Didymella rabiei TaxID=5454 RepID=A0A163FY98_DIDRA|nr:serine-type peptidase [Ascochyta rabiei]
MPERVFIFPASDVYDCVSRVPFDAAVASRFIDYYNETLEFQSTLTFLENPPEGYQQPPVNVQQELEYIRANISSGMYKSQYTFEAQVQLLVRRMHDSHVILDSGIMSPFRYASPYTLISVSQDGLREPQIYLQEDLLAATIDQYNPSPVSKINNVEVVEYLTSLAELNSDGYVEPHADWNSLMDSPANDVQGYLSLFQRLIFYPGNELNFTFENGTTLDTIWIAIYVEDSYTGPLTTPGDFYNYFVMGLVPADFDESAPSVWWPAEYNITWNSSNLVAPPTESNLHCSSDAGLVKNWCSVSNGLIEAYPNDPVVVQRDLSIVGAGVVSGYIMEDISTGILSIPSFYQGENHVNSFSDAIDEFIGNATAKNTKRVIIDLQQNGGGLILLALRTFKKFFPTISPYTGSRIRSHEIADILGTAYTKWWQSLDTSLDQQSDDHEFFAASEWVATNRINAATGLEFNSWAEYFGPVLDHGDKFSNKQSYNLSDRAFDRATFGTTYGAWENSSSTVENEKWAPDNIVLLTDGLCSSACAIFVELMTAMANVRTISLGGRPVRGPMQTASGNRGAAPYTAYDLDNDYDWLQTVLGDEDAFQRLHPRKDTGVFTKFASINIRDQMRPDDLIPLQFRYEPSDCRLYYTPNNVYNMSRLWRDVATAAWTNSSTCTPGSTGFSTRTKTGRKQPPKPSTGAPARFKGPEGPPSDSLDISPNATAGLIDVRFLKDLNKYRKCKVEESVCEKGFSCRSVPSFCPPDKAGPLLDLCFPNCQSDRADCVPVRLAESPAQQVDVMAAAGRFPTLNRPSFPGVMTGEQLPRALYTGFRQRREEIFNALEFNVPCS